MVVYARKVPKRRRFDVGQFALGASGAALFFSLLLVLVPLLGSICSVMSVPWLVTVVFENQTGEDVRVTLIGTTEGGWRTEPIRTNVLVSANGNASVEYNWDDVNLQFVLVAAGGRVKLLSIDAYLWNDRGYRACCYAPAEDRYAIPPLDGLPDAPAPLLPTLEGDVVPSYPG